MRRAGLLRGDPARVIKSIPGIERSGVGRSPLVAFDGRSSARSVMTTAKAWPRASRRVPATRCTAARHASVAMAMAKPLTLPARTAIQTEPCGAGSTVMAPSMDCAARCRAPTPRIFNPAATGIEPPSHCATPAWGPWWRKPSLRRERKSSRRPGKHASCVTADRPCAPLTTALHRSERP